MFHMTSRRGATLPLLLACFLLTAAAFGQDADGAADPDRHDDPVARQEWFRRGRTLKGESAASRLQRAYRQKMMFRAAQRARSTDPSQNAMVANTNAPAPSSSSGGTTLNATQPPV